MAKRPIKEFSAGGIVYKKENKKVLWLVIQPKDKDRWQLPKGWIDEGENARTAAIREVIEEGGVKAEMVDKVDTISFFFRDSYKEDSKQLVNKKVTFFLMAFQNEIKKGPDPKEVEKIEWLPFEKAYQRLTFDSEKKVLEKAKKILEEKVNQPKLL